MKIFFLMSLVLVSTFSNVAMARVRSVSDCDVTTMLPLIEARLGAELISHLSVDKNIQALQRDFHVSMSMRGSAGPLSFGINAEIVTPSGVTLNLTSAPREVIFMALPRIVSRHDVDGHLIASECRTRRLFDNVITVQDSDTHEEILSFDTDLEVSAPMAR